jgi:hypothetical protein
LKDKPLIWVIMGYFCIQICEGELIPFRIAQDNFMSVCLHITFVRITSAPENSCIARNVCMFEYVLMHTFIISDVSDYQISFMLEITVKRLSSNTSKYEWTTEGTCKYTNTPNKHISVKVKDIRTVHIYCTCMY